MKKLLILLLLTTLALSVGIGSAQEVMIPDELPEGVTITYWHEWDEAQQEGIDLILNDFNENNPWGIVVEQVYQGNTGALIGQMNTAVVSGELPNISGAMFPDIAQGMYLEGVLVPLDDYINHPVWGFSEEEAANITPGLLDINRVPGEPFNNQLLAWPVGVSANVMSVNMDMVNALGFDSAPSTLEDFRAVACGAAELTGPNGEDVQGFPIRVDTLDMFSFIVSNGGSVFDADTLQYNFTNDGAIETLQFFQDLYNDGCAYIPESTYSNTADLALGLNPMAVGSSAGTPFINSDIENSGSGIETWVNTTMPWTEGNRTIQLFLRSNGIFVSTPEEQLASWLFLKHTATPESQIAWTDKAQYIPYTAAGLAAVEDGTVVMPEQVIQVAELLQSDDVHVWAAPQILGSNAIFVGVFDELVAAITTGGQDVMEAAAAAEAEANETLAEAAEDL